MLEVAFYLDCDWEALLQTLAEVNEGDANIFTKTNRGNQRYVNVLRPDTIKRYLKNQQEDTLRMMAQENRPACMGRHTQIRIYVALPIKWSVDIKKDLRGTRVAFEEYTDSITVINTSKVSNWKKLFDVLAHYQAEDIASINIMESDKLSYSISNETMKETVARLTEQQLSKMASAGPQKMRAKL